MSKSKNIIIGLSALALIGLVVAALLYFENKNNKLRIKELEEDKLKLILDSLKRHPSLTEELKIQIEKLILEFQNVDEKISNELAQALQLFQIGQVENAIEDLAKIIEYLLVSHYTNDPKFSEWLKGKKKEKNKLHLHDLLIYCRDENKINEIEYAFFNAIKTVRNKEDHTVDLKLDNYLNISGLIVGLGGIVKIATIVYPRQLPQPQIEN